MQTDYAAPGPYRNPPAERITRRLRVLTLFSHAYHARSKGHTSA